MTRKHIKSIIALTLAAMLMLALTAACGGETSPDDAGTMPVVAEPTDIGQGSSVFLLEMTDAEGAMTVWNVHTDETTVGAALLEVGLIEGETSSYGLMVIYVNGIRADYAEDGAYWAFFVDGDYALAGADATAIEQGRVYAFVYTEG